MEWYYIAAIAVVVVVVIALMVRARSGQGGEVTRETGADSPAAGIAPATQAPADPTARMDDGTVAAIAAVVLSMWSGGDTLVIREIRRAGAPESVWSLAGKLELTQSNG